LGQISQVHISNSIDPNPSAFEGGIGARPKRETVIV
jgi:hypothetical protein